MAHVQRLGTKGDYRYKVRYLDDQQVERARTFRLKGDADTFLTAVSHQLLAGTYIDPSAGKVTVKAFGEVWRANQAHLRPTSARSLEHDLTAHIYPVLGLRPMSAVRPSEVAAWQRDLLQRTEKPLAAATVKRIRGQLSAMFKAAILDRVVTSNPVAGVKAPTVVREVIVPLTVEQVAELEAGMPKRYQAIIALVAGSGLRPSEALGLTVDRVDFLRKTIRVDRQLVGRLPGGEPVFGPPKTPRSNRVVPIADVTVKRLARHVAQFPPVDGLLFTTSQRGAVTREVFGKAWRPAAEGIGMPKDKGLHQVRHFYASLLIAAGRSVKEVQARLGHTSAVETLDVYSHLFPDSEDGTRAAIESALGATSDQIAMHE